MPLNQLVIDDNSKFKTLAGLCLIGFAALAFGRASVMPKTISNIKTTSAVKIVSAVKTVSAARPIAKTVNVPPAASTMPIVLPSVISRVMPEYPVSARREGLGAYVVAQILVGIDGTAKEVSLSQSSGNIEFDNSAIAALKQWRFSPALQNGAAAEFKFQVPVRFQIHGS
jgi:protein TonB